MMLGRLKRSRELEELKKAGCSEKQFAIAAKAIERINTAEKEKELKEGGLIRRILEARIIYQFSMDFGLLDSVGTLIDPSVNYVTDIKPLEQYTETYRMQSTGWEDAVGAYATVTKDVIENDWNRLKKQHNFFMYFGDLLNIVNDLMYEEGGDNPM